MGNWPWCSKEDNGLADKKYRYTLTSLSNPKRCIGFARRRMGRGGRVILDRLSSELDDYWRTLDFTIYDSQTKTNTTEHKVSVKEETDVNNFTYLDSNIYANSSNNNLKAPSTSVVTGYCDNLRTSVGDSFSESDCSRCKQEPVDGQEEDLSTQDVKNYPRNTDEMVEILRSVQREWQVFFMFFLFILLV